MTHGASNMLYSFHTGKLPESYRSFNSPHVSFVQVNFVQATSILYLQVKSDQQAIIMPKSHFLSFGGCSSLYLQSSFNWKDHEYSRVLLTSRNTTNTRTTSYYLVFGSQTTCDHQQMGKVSLAFCTRLISHLFSPTMQM